jgi:hypothetical protein
VAGVKLEAFQGLLPRASERLLPNMSATVARNTKLLNGELRGFRALLQTDDLTGQTSTLRRAFRVPDSPNDAWLAFDSREVDIVRSPLVNDTHDRYFWAGDGRPMMNTSARIKTGDPGYYLGVPVPGTAPIVTPPAGADETRAYVYTFVSAYGEEGQPSVPTLATGLDTGDWDVDMTTSVPDAASRNITTKYIYRTVPGNSSATFFKVGEVPVATVTFVDDVTNVDAANEPILESTLWAEPPVDMEGFVVMPNGYLIGWVGRRLVMSEPYRPHAWPVAYELSTEFDIVGLGVFGGTLVICTESHPYFGQGTRPASFTSQKIDAVEPCLSRRGIVSTTAGVLYPSVNGMVLANGSGVNVITKDLVTKEEWAFFSPSTLYAAQLGLQYIAFSTSSFGFIFDPTNPTSRLIELDNFTDVEGIETDRYSGNVLILSQDRVWEWDPELQDRLQWRWTSKLFQLPKPMNFGAARLQFDTGDQTNEGNTEDYSTYNQALFTAINALPGIGARLNTIGGGVIGGQPVKPATGLVPTSALDEIKYPLGGSMLYDEAFAEFIPSSVRVIVYVQAQGKPKKAVFDKQITTEAIFRLPTGFKSDLWQIEMIGNTTVYSLQFAETPKQLADV